MHTKSGIEDVVSVPFATCVPSGCNNAPNSETCAENTTCSARKKERLTAHRKEWSGVAPEGREAQRSPSGDDAVDAQASSAQAAAVWPTLTSWLGGRGNGSGWLDSRVHSLLVPRPSFLVLAEVLTWVRNCAQTNTHTPRVDPVSIGGAMRALQRPGSSQRHVRHGTSPRTLSAFRLLPRRSDSSAERMRRAAALRCTAAMSGRYHPGPLALQPIRRQRVLAQLRQASKQASKQTNKQLKETTTRNN